MILRPNIQTAFCSLFFLLGIYLYISSSLSSRVYKQKAQLQLYLLLCHWLKDEIRSDNTISLHAICRLRLLATFLLFVFAIVTSTCYFAAFYYIEYSFLLGRVYSKRRQSIHRVDYNDDAQPHTQHTMGGGEMNQGTATTLLHSRAYIEWMYMLFPGIKRIQWAAHYNVAQMATNSFCHV